MPLIPGSIANLINGVSQQAASLRLPTQCALMNNAYPSVVEGLKKRPPSQFLAKLLSGQLGDAFIHLINRDENERYVVVITDEDLKVYDLDGNQQTVTMVAGTSYLDESTPSSAFRPITIADFTFIANLNKTVTMSTDLSPNSGSKGLVFVKQANSNSDYKVFVDGVEKASHATSTTNIKTNYIATQLETQLNTNLGAGWTVIREGSTIEIVKDDDTAFELSIEDSQAGNSLKAIKDKVQRFTDLPTVAPNDLIIEVIGDQSSSFDNYFVKFETTNGETFADGVWKETVKPDIEFKFDSTTMPHSLIRQSDGTFTFETNTWGERIA